LGENLVSPELTAAIERLRKLQGSPQQVIERSNAVTRFVAGLNDTTRVFCRGTVQLGKGHFPAVLTYNSIYKQTLAWAPSGKKGAMEGHHEAFFWSNIPHESIAREVLSDDDRQTVYGGAGE
jgi:hypothetical protein